MIGVAGLEWDSSCLWTCSRLRYSIRVTGGWEGVVLLQLVLAGQNTLESRHGHGGREEGCCCRGIVGGGGSFLPEIICTAQD